MYFRIGLLAACVLAAGCAREGATDVARQGKGNAPVATTAAMAMGVASRGLVHRAGRLPDRGELVAYPGHVQRADGAYTWFRSDVSEAHAFRAVADGHLRLTTPEGRLLDVRFDRHVEHPSGDWTWIGHLPGEESAQTIITFGERAVFGSIAQPGGKPPLRLAMRDGVSWLVETDPRKVAAIVNAATRPTRPDYHIVRRADLPAARTGVRAAGAPVAAAAPVGTASAATATAANTIDLLVGYTGGFAAAQGSTSAAVTRINYLVDVANAALANSQVSAQVRVVHTMQVSYTDLNTNDLALQEMSGYDADAGHSVPPSSAFTALRNARETYGADLVTLIRPFKDPEQDSCGLAWLLGGAKQGIQPNAGWDGLAYSVVGDGEDVSTDGKTYYCRDETLAHEMGHNEGSAHDRATAEGGDNVLNDPDDYGVFTYSFGYKTTSTTGNFYTVMAYGDSGQTGYRVFSNPRITFCGGRACGTTTFEDNARSLSQTIPVVAGFRAIVVPLAGQVRSDFNGDGRSDVFWRNTSTGGNTIWKAANSANQQAMSPVQNLAWASAGTGDFNGDGNADVLWHNGGSGASTIWRSGNSATQQSVATIMDTDWVVAGLGDFDADGRTDILWRNTRTGGNTIWASANSATPKAVTSVTNLAWTVAGVGDFDGDGHADILWRNGQTGGNTIWRSANSATPQAIASVTNLAWGVADVGDFNGDGKADVYWRNNGTGANVIWKSANSATQQSMASVVGSDWSPATVGDYDGDGRADVLWRNTRTGANTIWRSANSTTQQGVAPVTDLAWHVAS